MFQWKKRAFISGIFVLASTQALAGQPIMIITPNMTSVDLPNSGTATVSYTVTNNTPQNQKQFSIFADSNISDKAAKKAISVQNNTCTGVVSPQQSCGFDILLTSNSNLKSNFVLSPKVCAYNNLVCSEPDVQNRVQVNLVNAPPPVPLKAYVCDGSDNLVFECTVSAGSLTNCVSTGSDFSDPGYSAINADKTLFYVVQPFTDNITVCSFSLTGDLNCSVVTVPVPMSNLLSGAIAVHPSNQFIYVADTHSPSNIYKCDTDFNVCEVSSLTMDRNSDLTIDPTGTYIYIPQSNGSLKNCSFLGNGDINNSCVFSPAPGPSQTLKIAINDTETLAYVVGQGTQEVFLCELAIDGSLSTCSPQASVPAHMYTDIALTPDGTYAYISTDTTIVQGCPILQNGTLGVCVENSSFSESGGIVFR